MWLFFSRLTPATVRAYATCLERRGRDGKMPPTEEVERIAAEQGANPAPVLALARFEIRNPDGRVVDLTNDVAGPAIVRDPETARAILARDYPSVRITDAWGGTIRPGMLDVWANCCTAPARGSSHFLPAGWGCFLPLTSLGFEVGRQGRSAQRVALVERGLGKARSLHTWDSTTAKASATPQPCPGRVNYFLGWDSGRRRRERS